MSTVPNDYTITFSRSSLSDFLLLEVARTRAVHVADLPMFVYETIYLYTIPYHRCCHD